MKQHLSPALVQLNPFGEGVGMGVADVSQSLPSGLDPSLAHSCSFCAPLTPTTEEIKHRTCLFRRLSDNGRAVNRFPEFSSLTDCGVGLLGWPGALTAKGVSFAILSSPANCKTRL